MKKFLKMLLLVFFLLIIFVYVLVIEKIPSKITLFEGEKMELKTILGIKIEDEGLETVEASSNSGYKQNLQVSLFENITLKNVDVSVIPKTKVIPLGNIAGVKLYTNGVLVVGMSEIEGIDNKK